jgi:hemolysin-activating ACP:hemolysin acyltransferase
MARFFGSRDKASEPSGHQPAPHHPPGAITPEQHAAYQAAPEPEPAPPHSNASAQAAPGEQPDAETLEKIAALRAKLHETFGKVSLAMMTVPRYRHLPFGEMTSLILDPLIRDRIAMAAPTKDGVPANGALAGVAIWASVSPEVDAKIVDQIRAGTFPIRLQPEEWTSGDIHWLLDVVAPTPAYTAAVIGNFRQVLESIASGRMSEDTQMRIHPIVTRLVDRQTLKRIGVTAASALDQSERP